MAGRRRTGESAWVQDVYDPAIEAMEQYIAEVGVQESPRNIAIGLVGGALGDLDIVLMAESEVRRLEADAQALADIRRMLAGVLAEFSSPAPGTPIEKT